MWLFTKYGQFSIVCARTGDGRSTNPPDPDRLMVRARSRRHLENLQRLFPEQLGSFEIAENAGTDYGFRIFAPKANVVPVVAQLFGDLNYDNFKSAVGKEQRASQATEPAYLDMLHRVWSAGFGFQEKVAPRSRRGYRRLFGTDEDHPSRRGQSEVLSQAAPLFDDPPEDRTCENCGMGLDEDDTECSICGVNQPCVDCGAETPRGCQRCDTCRDLPPELSEEEPAGGVPEDDVSRDEEVLLVSRREKQGPATPVCYLMSLPVGDRGDHPGRDAVREAVDARMIERIPTSRQKLTRLRWKDRDRSLSVPVFDLSNA